MKVCIAILLFVCTVGLIGGEIEINEEARYSGYYGMQVTLNNSLTGCVRDDTPAGESQYRARFYVKLNDITMTEGDELEIFTGNDFDDVTRFRIFVKAAADGMRLHGATFSFLGETVVTPLADSVLLDGDYHMIECEFFSSTDEDYFKISVDGAAMPTLGFPTTSAGRIDYVLLGVVYFGGGGNDAAGSLYLDDFKSGRTQPIGPLECSPIYLIEKDLPAWPGSRNVIEQIQIYEDACFNQP